jgi:2-polyprenyl-3-methyl-5-hydroxy-6-metoxy-1,4-benzoquinol methylase
MVEQARALNADVSNLSFTLGDAERLDHGPFDLVLTLIVLQHLPRKSDIVQALLALTSRLRQGGTLVLGVPNHIPARHRLQPRQRLYRLLRALGVKPGVLYERFGLTPIGMQAIADEELRKLFARCGVDVVDVRRSVHASGVRSSVYLAKRR